MGTFESETRIIQIVKEQITNTVFVSGEVTCKPGALCFYSSSVLVDSFVLQNLARMPRRKTLGAILKERYNK